MSNPRTEAVARAIVLAEDPDSPEHQRWVDQWWSLYIPRAQAAEKALIEALMEPSESMIVAGEANNFAGDDGFYDFASANVWRAMLKAAGEGQ